MHKVAVRSFRSAQCPPLLLQESDQFLAGHPATIHIIHTHVNAPTCAMASKTIFLNEPSPGVIVRMIIDEMPCQTPQTVSSMSPFFSQATVAPKPPHSFRRSLRHRREEALPTGSQQIVQSRIVARERAAAAGHHESPKAPAYCARGNPPLNANDLLHQACKMKRFGSPMNETSSCKPASITIEENSA